MANTEHRTTSNMSNSNELPSHHIKQNYCETRRKYRNGRKKTSVRVFTINQESKYIIVTNIQSTGLQNDLAKLCGGYGTLSEFKELKDYPREQFTQAYLVKFSDILCARKAKKSIDERYFYGTMLHVFYAPEYESVDEVREKLNERRRSVVSRIRFLSKNSTNKTKKKPLPKAVMPKAEVVTEEPCAIWNSEQVYQEEISKHKLVPQRTPICKIKKEEIVETTSLKRKLQSQTAVIQQKYMKSASKDNNIGIMKVKSQSFLPRSVVKKSN